MAIEIKVPDIGIDEAEVTEILVKVGDKITIDQSILTIEGHKASMEIPSPYNGVVEEIKVSIGDRIETGKTIMTLNKNQNLSSSTSIKVNKQKSTFTKNIYLPSYYNNEVKVTDILVKPGETVKKEQPLIIVEHNKKPIEISAPYTGVIKEIIVKINDQISSDSLIMILELKVVDKNFSSSKVKLDSNQLEIVKIDFKEKDINESKFIENSDIHTTPLIRRLARKFNVDLLKIKGTGKKGRILLEDIQDYIGKETINSLSIESNSLTEETRYLSNLLKSPKINFENFGEIDKTKLSRIQKISGTNLSRNWITVPHVTHFDKVDITELESFRNQQNIKIINKEPNIKITLLVFIMKAVSSALQQMSKFNSSLSEDKEYIVIKKYINIGIAIDTPTGLVVPVFKNVLNKGVIQLSKELISITKKARNNKLIASEMQGGTFTISSIGNLGTTYFTPIINAPEVAILGVSKSRIEPIWNGKEFKPRLILPISLSFDHRVIDGADAARFINIINNNLNDIRYLIM